MKKRTLPDRSKINLYRPEEVRYWTRALGVNEEAMQRAIEKVGNSAAAVRKELGLIRPATVESRKPLKEPIG